MLKRRASSAAAPANRSARTKSPGRDGACAVRRACSRSAPTCCSTRSHRRSCTSRRGIAAAAIPIKDARAQFFAQVGLVVGVLTGAVQLFMTRAVIARLGVAGALTLVPGLTVIGFAALATSPTLWVYGLAALVSTVLARFSVGLTGIALAAIPVALLWLFNSVKLGRAAGARAVASAGEKR